MTPFTKIISSGKPQRVTNKEKRARDFHGAREICTYVRTYKGCTYVRTYARTHVRTYVRTYVRTQAVPVTTATAADVARFAVAM